MKTIFLIFTAIVIAGCSVFPKSITSDVNRSVTLEQVQANPASHTGQKVLWGGIILNTENLEKYTQVEVLESELSFDERPYNGESRGRFLIQSPGYLDANIFAKNKRVSVVGTVKGTQAGTIGKMEYLYPVVEPLDVRVFEPVPVRSEYEYPYYPHMYGPYYPYSPFYPYGPYSPYGPYRNPYYPYPYPFP